MIKIAEENIKRIEEIKNSMQCPKDFECVACGFENLCKVRDFGDDQSLQCLEETTPPCSFAGVYDYGFLMCFCRCPLRVYIAKNLGK